MEGFPGCLTHLFEGHGLALRVRCLAHCPEAFRWLERTGASCSGRKQRAQAESPEGGAVLLAPPRLTI